VNGGQGGGYPPAGGQWPGDGSGGTPYGGQDPYAAPSYGQGSYGGAYGGTQPQGGIYGGPYGQTPSYGPGGPGFGTEPPKKSRTGLIVGLAVGAAVVVLGGAAAIIGVASGGDKPASAASPLSSGASSSSAAATPSSGDGGNHTLTLPATVGPYHRMTGTVADRLAETMRKAMNQDSSGKYADVYAKSKIAIYAKNGDATRPLIFVGLSANDSPSIAEELRTRTPSEEVDSTFLGMGLGDAKDYPPGPLGGVLRCGTGPMGGSTAAACAWADSSTVGALIAPQSGSAAALAGTTLDLRNAAEH
jgi:hypothetical protein